MHQIHPTIKILSKYPLLDSFKIHVSFGYLANILDSYHLFEFIQRPFHYVEIKSTYIPMCIQIHTSPNSITIIHNIYTFLPKPILIFNHSSCFKLQASKTSCYASLFQLHIILVFSFCLCFPIALI